MTQLLLDLAAPPAPSLDNFIPGRNVELLHRLREWAASDSSERCIYLWGSPGSGCTHLLRAAAAECGGGYVDSAALPDPQVETTDMAAWCGQAETSDSRSRWCVDHVQAATPAAQIDLFNLINAARAQPHAALLVAGDAAPLHLSLREDVRTRLGWGLVFEVHALNDEEKDAALERHAHERGFDLPPDLRRHLLTRFSRDMPSLMRLVEALDRYALERQRPLTLPLVRDFERDHLNKQERGSKPEHAS